LVVNRFGEGTSVYFAGQPDRMNHLAGHTDFDNLLSGAVRLLQGGKPLVCTNAPGSLHAWVSRTPDTATCPRLLLSLVNVAGGTERPLRSLLPVRDVEVELRLPPGHRWTHRFLYREHAGEVDYSADRVRLRLVQL